MSQNFDDILTAAQNDQQPEQPKGATLEPFDKDAYMEKKQSEREAAFRLADVTAERAASSPDAYAAYLNVQARFNRYSVNNALLIAAQMPDAAGLAEQLARLGIAVFVFFGAHAPECQFHPVSSFSSRCRALSVSAAVKKGSQHRVFRVLPVSPVIVPERFGSLNPLKRQPCFFGVISLSRDTSVPGSFT